MSPANRFPLEAHDVLAPLFTVEYMGAWEFEHEKVAETFQKIYRANEALNAATFKTTIAPTDGDILQLESHATHEPHWLSDPQEIADYLHPYKVAYRLGGKPRDITYCILAPHSMIEYAKGIIAGLAKDDDCLLQESSRLRDAALRKAWAIDTVGWLELDNRFFFTADFPMFDRVCRAFGVTHAIKPPEPSGKAERLLLKRGVTTDALSVDRARGSFHARAHCITRIYRGTANQIVGHGRGYHAAVRNLGDKIERAQKAGAFFRPFV